MKLFSKFAASALSLCIAATSIGTGLSNIYPVSAKSGNCMAEYLDRGISAINTGSGMLVNWRFLASDSESSVFNLYRDGKLIYTSDAGKATCYLDASGSANSKYQVESVVDGKVVSTSNCSMISGNSYFDIPLDLPIASGCTYSPNDCSVGDVDGDGVYELFVKWDPSNSKDNSQKGTTGNVFIDCYKLTGQKLWRIDLGVNIRAGAHYTQFYVADFDLDGKAEMTCKTADGTIDGQGNAIGDKSKNYRNSSGFIITGPEYYTLFDGATGKALDTINYEPGRGDTTKWGKTADKTNRVDRFWGAVAYLDGVHPSVVTGRGYYGRMTATAYKVENKKLVKLWAFDTGTSSSAAGYGDGNHNSMAADVDGDGKQEIINGSTCIDDNGKLLWCTNQGHGDAMHLGDLLPDRTGLELWICHEDRPYGVSLVDASNGKIIFHKDGSGDTGRCCADNVWSGNNGAEFWGLNNDVFDGSGNTLSCRRPAINFLSYWDGDLEREILDGYTDSPATISKMKEDGKLTTLLSTDGYYTCNTTKGTPCLSADIFGDWREELIVRAADSKSVRIYCTPYTTDYRITTLMHDIQYRTQVAGQNTAYNQPPHLSYYLGTEKGIPKRETVQVMKPGQITPIEPVSPLTEVTLTEGAVYTIQNVNSGLHMEVEGAKDANGTNVQQWGMGDSPSGHNTWRVLSAGDGYYYLYPQIGDKASYALDVTAKKPDDGTNIEIYKSSFNDAQKFKFMKNADDKYFIVTKVSGDKSCVAVSSASKSSGANIIEWTMNTSDTSQMWVLNQVDQVGCKMDTSKEYTFKNMNSGLYMEVANASAQDNANIQQWGIGDAPALHNTWTLRQFQTDSDLYYIYSKLADGRTYVLNSTGADDGANIELLTYNNKTSSMLFKFIKNPDGSYYIQPRSGRDSKVVEVANASMSSGANIGQWSINGNPCQKWNLETYEVSITTTTTTTETSGIAVEIIGDVNLDGKMDMIDVVIIQKYLVNISNEIIGNADLNGDNRINIFDLSIAKDIIMNSL